MDFTTAHQEDHIEVFEEQLLRWVRKCFGVPSTECNLETGRGRQMRKLIRTTTSMGRYLKSFSPLKSLISTRNDNLLLFAFLILRYRAWSRRLNCATLNRPLKNYVCYVVAGYTITIALEFRQSHVNFTPIIVRYLSCAAFGEQYVLYKCYENNYFIKTTSKTELH